MSCCLFQLGDIAGLVTVEGKRAGKDVSHLIFLLAGPFPLPGPEQTCDFFDERWSSTP